MVVKPIRKTISTTLIILIIAAVAIYPVSAEISQNTHGNDIQQVIGSPIIPFDQISAFSQIPIFPKDTTDISQINNSVRPILPLDPNENTLPSIETNYNDLGSLQSEIMRTINGFKPPQRFKQNTPITTVKKEINLLKNQGFSIQNTSYVILETTETYTQIKDVLTNDMPSQTSNIPNVEKAYTSTHTYILENLKTNDDAVIIQCYISDENKKIIGQPLIAKTHKKNTDLNLNTSYTKTIQASQPNQNVALAQSAIIPLAMGANASPTAAHSASPTLTPSSNKTANKTKPTVDKYIFTPQTHYIRNAAKTATAIAIIVGIAGGGYYLIALAPVGTITAGAVTTTMLVTVSVIGLGSQFVTEEHEFYSINAYNQSVETIRINPSQNPTEDIYVPERSRIILDKFGGFTTYSSLSGIERTWSPYTSAYVYHFININNSYPHTVYKIPLSITIPDNANSFVGDNDMIVVTQDGQLIATIEQPQRERINTIVYTENKQKNLELFF